jgi:hypothetical protein
MMKSTRRHQTISAPEEPDVYRSNYYSHHPALQRSADVARNLMQPYISLRRSDQKAL